MGMDLGQVRFQVNGQVVTYRRSEVSEIALNRAKVPTSDNRPLIRPGETIEEVEAVLGKPQELFDMGAKKVYLYDNPARKVTFRDGKVVEGAGGASQPAPGEAARRHTCAAT